MPTVVPIVEGDGEVLAVPLLLRRLFSERNWWGWQVASPMKFGISIQLNQSGQGWNITSELERRLRLAQHYEPCDAILLLQDLDDGCPVEAAHELSEYIQRLDLRCPLAVVLACREYEAWFLASLRKIAGSCGLPQNLSYTGEIEGRRDVKGWLTSQMPPGRIYSPTRDQVKMTNLIDLELARQHSRSFRRLCNAIELLVQAVETGQGERTSPVRRREGQA